MKNIIKEKAHQYGFNYLTDDELIKLSGYKGKDFYISMEYKAMKELARREDRSENTKIQSSSDIYKHYKFMEDLDHEQFHVLLLNNKNVVIKSVFIGKGDETGTVVGVKEILKQVIENKAKAIVLCHNHPSGSMRPSTADCEITNKIKQAALLVDSRVLDHVIVGRGYNDNPLYYSFADEGIL